MTRALGPRVGRLAGGFILALLVAWIVRASLLRGLIAVFLAALPLATCGGRASLLTAPSPSPTTQIGQASPPGR